MVIFHSYVSLPEGNPIKPPFCWLNPIKPPFSYGFPMVFLWFNNIPILSRTWQVKQDQNHLHKFLNGLGQIGTTAPTKHSSMGFPECPLVN